MVHVQILTPRWDEAQQCLVRDVRADLRVEKDRVAISGEVAYIPFDVPVVDPETHRQLHFRGPDPEAWARCLPFAFRSGDVVADVVEVTAPAREMALAGAE